MYPGVGSEWSGGGRFCTGQVHVEHTRTVEPSDDKLIELPLFPESSGVDLELS